MENTNELGTISDYSPSRDCLNYDLVSSVKGDINAGLALMTEQFDPEIEHEIQRKREELLAICAACPNSRLSSDDSLGAPAPVIASDGAVLRSAIGRQSRPSDVLGVARRLGLNITTGGNHQFSIEGTDGRKFAVPSSLSPKVISNARKFLANYILN